MIQILEFIIIYTMLIAVWFFVFINRGSDEINKSFLIFVGSILVWMVLNILDIYIVQLSYLAIFIKILYMTMLFNMAIFYLYFVYKFVARKLGVIFYSIVFLNTITIISRFFFPIDFLSAHYWTLKDPIIAPIMSTVFTLPMIFAIYLMLKKYISSDDKNEKKQVKLTLFGIVAASIISILSEYIIPNFMVDSSNNTFMYIAIFTLVMFIYIAIRKHKFLNVQTEYIYNKLFLNASEAIIIVNKELEITSSNYAAQKIFNDDIIDSKNSKSKITNYINGYSFNTDYLDFDVKRNNNGKNQYLSLTQYPMDLTDKDSEKLLYVHDLTFTRKLNREEKEYLISKSLIDPLTGLYNRGYLNDLVLISPELNKAYTVLFMDIDKFKSINDVYGHDIGDEVLKAVANIITNSIRNEEKAVRYGGDEFLVIFEDLSLEDAHAVSERIRINTNNLQHSKEFQNMSITLSIGISIGIKNLETLIKKADTAMYNSKKRNGNLTTIYKESMTKNTDLKK